MNKKLLALYGLKWNPFAPDVPVEALHLTPRIESFCWRSSNSPAKAARARSGAPGAGKSVALRILAERLAAQRDVKVGVCSRPQAIARWAICSASSSAPTTAGPAPRCCASAGRPTSTPRSRGHAHRRRGAGDAVDRSLRVRLLSSTRLDSHICSRSCSPATAASSSAAIRRVPPARQPHAWRLALERATADELDQYLRHALKRRGHEADDA